MFANSRCSNVPWSFRLGDPKSAQCTQGFAGRLAKLGRAPSKPRKCLTQAET
jgi:hypothetical protein